MYAFAVWVVAEKMIMLWPPITTSVPSATGALPEMRAPLTTIGLVADTHSTFQPPWGSALKTACCRETASSSSWISFVASRPTRATAPSATTLRGGAPSLWMTKAGMAGVCPLEVAGTRPASEPQPPRKRRQPSLRICASRCPRAKDSGGACNLSCRAATRAARQNRRAAPRRWAWRRSRSPRPARRLIPRLRRRRRPGPGRFRGPVCPCPPEHVLFVPTTGMGVTTNWTCAPNSGVR